MNDAGPETRPAYRGDVQGMRALAVLVVIAAHAGVPGVAGGFIGVDVFFVISGFLITQMICTSVSAEGRFSIGGFYARRARRILPAATLVLVATTTASVIYLDFLAARDAAIDAVWASVFAVNVHFAQQGVDYFALEDAASPTQHYWSLAIEEQFYLVWPLLVLVAMLLTRRRRESGRAPLRTMGFFVVLVTGASLTWSIMFTPEEPTAAYFSSLTRAWELGIGALLALTVHAGLRVKWRILSAPLALIGLVGIGLAVVLYDADTTFPGVVALLPTLSAAALLLAGTHLDRQPALSRLLAITPFRTIGDWSYSLYLWHWPLLVIPQQHLGRSLSTTETVIAVALTFQLAYLSYRFVEQPFRRGRFWRRGGRLRRGLAIYPVAIALSLATAFGAQWWSTYSASERGNDPGVTTSAFNIHGEEVTGLVAASVRAADEGWAIPSDLSPDLLYLHDDIADVGECNYRKWGRELCRRGDVDANKVMVVTGDSHARAWIPALDQIARQAGYAAYYLVKPECTAAFVDPGRLGSGEPWPECREFHDWVVTQIEELAPDLLVVASSPPPTGVFDPETGELVKRRNDLAEQLVGGYDDMFATYTQLVKDVQFIADVPRLPKEPGACLAAQGATLADCVFEPTPWADVMREVSIESAERAEVPIIDPEPWLCHERRCPVVIGSTIAWRDRGHISATRAAELWEPLGRELGLLD